MQYYGHKIPVYHDVDHSVHTSNIITGREKLVMTDSRLNILYAGMPIGDKNFDKAYEAFLHSER
jgi:hypothetical protein